jgi:hypothetical protein
LRRRLKELDWRKQGDKASSPTKTLIVQLSTAGEQSVFMIWHRRADFALSVFCHLAQTLSGGT